MGGLGSVSAHPSHPRSIAGASLPAGGRHGIILTPPIVMNTFDQFPPSPRLHFDAHAGDAVHADRLL